jgi:hypothetical protein
VLTKYCRVLRAFWLALPALGLPFGVASAQAAPIKFTFTKIVDLFEAEPGVPGATFDIPAQGAPGNSGTQRAAAGIAGP